MLGPYRHDVASRSSVAERTTSPDPGAEGNSRLTASAALVLLLLLAAEGVTLLSIHSLLRPHVFIGLLLVPPVALKISSTVYRFARYYAGDPAYRRKGPPHPALRFLGPVVILATVALLTTGAALGVVSGGSQRQMLLLHKASFVIWFAVMTLHVLGHVAETARIGPRDWWPTRAGISGRPRAHQGGASRRWSLAASIVAGLLLAGWGLSHLGPWVSSWQ
jgi:hypothetical protein